MSFATSCLDQTAQRVRQQEIQFLLFVTLRFPSIPRLVVDAVRESTLDLLGRPYSGNVGESGSAVSNCHSYWSS